MRFDSANYAVGTGQTRKIVMRVDPARVDGHAGRQVAVELTVTMTSGGGKLQTVAVRRLSIVAGQFKLQHRR